MFTQINASAGSGKTYTLTRRFLQLLENAAPVPRTGGCVLHGRTSGYSLGEILAATFTNKAAAEMKNRVIRSLKEEALRERAASVSPETGSAESGVASGTAGHAGHGPLSGSAEKWVEQVLRHYSSLNIRTIDSLLANLVRLSALQLGLPPDFEPSFDPAEYFTPLYDALMEELAPALNDAAGELGHTPDPAPGHFPGHFPGHSPGHVPGPTSAAASGQAAGNTADNAEGNASLAPRAPAILTSDAATLRAGLEQACENLANTSDYTGFTPRNTLHDALLLLTERLLRGEETPPMHSADLFGILRELHTAATRAAADMLEILEGEQLKANVHYKKFLLRCQETPHYSALPDSAFLHKNDLNDCLLKSSQDAFSGNARRVFAKSAAAFQEYARTLPLLQQALTVAPLIELAAELHARISARMHEGADKLLPALLLPGMAGQVLQGESGVSDALCRLGARLSQILLDEFQDTSREQWAAIAPLGLESLSTGGSLTYVGDVKQAIYGWRGGDAGLFEDLAVDPELTAISGPVARKTLKFNWRSHPLVVEHNNAFFSRLAAPDTAHKVLAAMLPEKTPDVWIDRAAALTTRCFSDAVQQIPPEKDWQGDPLSARAAVRLYRVETKNLDDLNARVKSRLRSLLQDELLPVWRYMDIAVLVRTGDEAASVAAWLAEWGIPVVTENSFLLEANPLVSRLVSFLSFLAYPLDDLAFWEFVGQGDAFASQDAADEWLAGVVRLHGKKRPPLYRLFQKDFPAFWNACIAPFHARAGLMSAYDTLMEVVRRLGLEKSAPGQMPFVRRLLELAHLAEGRGHSSLAAFLAFWRELGNNEKLPLPESMNAVRILTIHKAKGLEFPVVILPFQHRGQTRTPSYTPMDVHGVRLLAKVRREQPDLYYPQIVTDELERLNLLYVAWTRPVYALHAFITNPGRTGPLIRALEVLLEDFAVQTETLEPLPEDGESGVAETAPGGATGDVSGGATGDVSAAAPGDVSAAAPGDAPGKTSEDSASKATDCAANEAAGGAGVLPDLAPDEWRPMNWLPRLRIYRSPLPAPMFTPRQRGILAHLCLEHLVLGNTPADAAKTRESSLRTDVQKAIALGIRHFPFPLDNADKTAAELARGLSWFASTPLARFWLETGRREQEIMDAQGRMHRVDLLADEALAPLPVQADGAGVEPPAAPVHHAPALHAVDYKTGKPDPAYREQVLRYMRLCSQASGRPVRGFLVYLDEQRLEEILPGNATGGSL